MREIMPRQNSRSFSGDNGAPSVEEAWALLLRWMGSERRACFLATGLISYESSGPAVLSPTSDFRLRLLDGLDGLDGRGRGGSGSISIAAIGCMRGWFRIACGVNAGVAGSSLITMTSSLSIS